MIDTPAKRGRHRAPSRWSRHRPAHEDPQRGLISLLIPSWKSSAPGARLRPPAPGTHREQVIIDDRTGPQWTVDEPGPSIEVILEDHDVLFEDRDPPSEEPTEVSSEAPIDQPAIEPLSQEAPSTVVDRSDVLPSSAPDERSTLASLFGFGERQVSFVPEWSRDFDVDGDTAWESLPTLADVAIEGEVEGTGGSIRRLWEATEEHAITVDPIADGIEEPQPRLLDDQRVRRSMVAVGIVVVLLAAWGIRQLGDQPNRAAVAREVQFTTAADEIRLATDPVRSQVPLLGQAELEPSQVSSLTGTLDVLDGAARRAAALANEPLPRTPLGGSSLPIDALVLPQSLLEQASVQALGIEQRIGDAITYRLTYAGAFLLPELPAEASLVEIGEIGGRLSVAIAETEQVLSQLPDDGFFAEHRQASNDFVERLKETQVAYFSALRAENTSEAMDIRRSIERGVEELRAGLADPLSAVMMWSDEQFDQLDGVLAEIDQLLAS